MRRHRGKSFTASHAFIAQKAFFCKRRRSTALRQTREANGVSSGPVAQVECSQAKSHSTATRHDHPLRLSIQALSQSYVYSITKVR